ncbi:YceI family protein [Paenibacillus hodogayensis]|uniref:YceI family protein n=1 Tax=Paenibacillus hodogayensis TaxID=279208 RepID=A0ABV5VU83_9BACL
MAKTTWAVDPTHSGIDFSVKHMMIANVKGSFHSFEATIDADPQDLTSASVEFTIDVSSIDTRNKDRDAHLLSADFFDTEKYPKIGFKSTGISAKGDGEYDVTGDLSLHGVTRPETFQVTFEGAGKDPWGNEKVGFSGKGKIKRSDFGLSYNAVLEAGGVLIGDEIKISLEIEGVKQA